MREDHEIGHFIRQVRKERDMTLTQLAERTGFSQGYLSKVEKLRSSPSVSVLIKIAKALDVRLSYLFGEAESETAISLVKKKERREMARDGTHFGYVYEALAPQFLNRRMDPFILTKKAGSEVTPVFQHEGQEMMYVIEGTMKFCHGTKEFIVEEGDCVYYDASLPHGGTVIGDRDLKCLVVIYTPET